MDATLAAPATAATALPAWIGSPVCDAEGAPVGHVADVLFDAHTRAPGWVLVARPEGPVLAPARGLRHRARGVQLACHEERIRTAPSSLTPPGGLGRADALALAQHFGVRCGAGPWVGVVEPTLARAAARRQVAAAG